VGDVKNRYSFTSDGLHNLAVYGVEPGEVWQILRASRRITRQMSEDANAVLGVTDEGRSLVAFVVESTSEDNDWDIVLAREMYPDEVGMFNRLAGGPT